MKQLLYRIFGLTLLFSLSACQTNQVDESYTPNSGSGSGGHPSAGRRAPSFSLGELIWVVHNNKKAESYFTSDLSFSSGGTEFYSRSAQAHALTFTNQSRIYVVSSESQDDAISRLISGALGEREGIAFVGLRTDNLNEVQNIFKRREIPFIQVSSGTKRAIFFPEFPRLKMFYFFETPGAELAAAKSQGPERHVNLAQGLNEVWIAVDDFYGIESDFFALGIAEAESALLQPFRATAKQVNLSSGSLHFVMREHLEDGDKQFLRSDSNTVLGASIRVDSIEATAKIMSKRKVSYATTRYNNKSCLLLPARTNFGSWLELARPMTPSN